MLEKAAAIKRFEYTQFGSQLKKQPDIAKKKKKKAISRIKQGFMSLIKRIVLKIWQAKVKIKHSRHNFNKFRNNKKFDGLCFTSKFNYLKKCHGKFQQL